LEKWGEGPTQDKDCEVMANETRSNYQKITHILDLTRTQQDHEGLDQILHARIKKLCMEFLTESNS
jgi:hypothetical protein